MLPYYIHLETGHRFRSKAEVMSFLETGVTGQKKRTMNGAGESPLKNGSHSKRSRKAAPKISAAVKNFNFDDVPAKVKWELTDIHEGTWRPLLDVGVSVPESTRQQWAETFTYLTMNQDVQAI
ncbi:Methyl-CpG-binding domain-containing protein [Drosera capensis]